jgi:hypothetical protein
MMNLNDKIEHYKCHWLKGYLKELIKNRDLKSYNRVKCVLYYFPEVFKNVTMNDLNIAMMHADDAYAGSQSFERLQKAVEDVLGKKYLLPVHQGRAAENVICRTFVKPGNVIPMNYHFTTVLAHVTENGGRIE